MITMEEIFKYKGSILLDEIIRHIDSYGHIYNPVMKHIIDNLND